MNTSSSNPLLQINLFSHLDDDESIVFCKTDFIHNAFEKIASQKRNCILISGNSDLAVNDTTIKQAPKNLKYWFSQNANSDKIFGIPIGLENISPCKISGHGHTWDHAIEKHQLISTIPNKPPSKLLYCNFSLDTNPGVRTEVFNFCSSMDFITVDVCSNHSQINNKKYSDYIDDILDHRMVVCPEGNGIDCHRIWETLLLGRVPIVKKSTAMQHFEQLPILYLEEWSQLKNLDIIKQRYNLVKNNSIAKLNFKYWRDLTLYYKSKL
jgi:hypothetical protein